MDRVVIDTNVLISGLQSKLGASYVILNAIGSGAFDLCLSVPLVAEYEAVAKRRHRALGLSMQDIDDVLDYLCAVALSIEIHYLWRPFLPDPGDDMILELAVASEASVIVTHNTSDFKGVTKFGIEAISPKAFLNTLRK